VPQQRLMEPPAPPQPFWQQQQEETLAGDSLQPAPPAEPPLAGENVMNIVMVGAECAPWSKTGGLGDVMGALPKAFARRGHRVMVVAPRYENYDNAWETGIRRLFRVCDQDVEVSCFVSASCGPIWGRQLAIEHPPQSIRKECLWGYQLRQLTTHPF